MYRVGTKSFRTQQAAIEYYGNALVWILKRAVELTPIDTGRLVNSYKLERYGQELNQVRIVNDCEYAIYVHEMDNLHENGQAKFLEYAGWLAMQVFDNLTVSIELDEEFVALYLDDISQGVDITGKYSEFDNFSFGSSASTGSVKQSVPIQNIANSENRLLDRLNDIKGSGYTSDTDWSTRPLDNDSYGVFLDMYLKAMEG